LQVRPLHVLTTRFSGGLSKLSVRNLKQEFRSAENALINQIKQQLTGDQQQKLDAIIAANGGRGSLPGLRLGPRGRGTRQ